MIKCLTEIQVQYDQCISQPALVAGDVVEVAVLVVSKGNTWIMVI